MQKRYIFENVAKVWKDYDLNKDNKISWEEYKQATYGYYLGKKNQGILKWVSSMIISCKLSFWEMFSELSNLGPTYFNWTKDQSLHANLVSRSATQFATA